MGIWVQEKHHSAQWWVLYSLYFIVCEGLNFWWRWAHGNKGNKLDENVIGLTLSLKIPVRMTPLGKQVWDYGVKQIKAETWAGCTPNPNLTVNSTAQSLHAHGYDLLLQMESVAAQV